MIFLTLCPGHQKKLQDFMSRYLFCEAISQLISWACRCLWPYMVKVSWFFHINGQQFLIRFCFVRSFCCFFILCLFIYLFVWVCSLLVSQFLFHLSDTFVLQTAPALWSGKRFSEFYCISLHSQIYTSTHTYARKHGMNKNINTHTHMHGPHSNNSN